MYSLTWMLLYAAANLCGDQRRFKYHFGVASSSCIQHNQVRYWKSNCKEKTFFSKGDCVWTIGWILGHESIIFISNPGIKNVVLMMCVFVTLRAHHGFGWVGEWANTGWAFDSYKPHFDELSMGIGLLVIHPFSSAFWYELCPRDDFRV
jgi:hypothetical protein